MITEKPIVGKTVYPLRYYEMDHQMVLKPSALLNFLQDMATVNAEKNGFGYSFTSQKNYGWFLIKYHMEFENYPEHLDDILIKTEARGATKLFASRDFEIWTTDETKCLGRVISDWFLLDMDKKEILQPLKVFDFMNKVEKRDDDLKFKKIIAPETFDTQQEFKIRYDDIDVNQHVNNSNYIVWAFETLPREFRANHKLKTLDILYKKEVSFGHNIISKLKTENNTTYHVLTNKETNEDLCLLEAQWI